MCAINGIAFDKGSIVGTDGRRRRVTNHDVAALMREKNPTILPNDKVTPIASSRRPRWCAFKSRKTVSGGGENHQPDRRLAGQAEGEGEGDEQQQDKLAEPRWEVDAGGCSLASARSGRADSGG